MKPYNTRKPRRGRFNAFPPTFPRWGRHRRRRGFHYRPNHHRRVPEQELLYEENQCAYYDICLGQGVQIHVLLCVIIFTCLASSLDVASLFSILIGAAIIQASAIEHDFST